MKKIVSAGLPLNLCMFFGAFLIGATVHAGIDIPLKSSRNWQALEYGKIPANKVKFDNKGLSIDVENSASPLTYRLEDKVTVKRVVVECDIQGSLSLTGKQGEDDQDDFLLKVGLVIEGDKHLNVFQRVTAPKWIKKLHDLAPKGLGIDRIVFFNVVSDQSILGESRRHPLSDLLEEQFVWAKKEEGKFSFTHELQDPLNALALWISSDGDDTGSTFSVRISSIRLED